MSKSFSSNQRAFRTNPKINPETGRTIKKGSKTFDELTIKYGAPVRHRSTSPKRAAKRAASPKRSPSKASPKRTYRSLSPKKVSPSRRTLAKSSPGRLNRSKDIYTVLPEQSVVTVLHKLNNNYKQEWIASSPYVRNIAIKHHLN